MSLYPMLLQPTLHVKVWGGRRLQTVLDKSLPTDEPYGESWELHDTATVMNGDHQGRSLGDLLTAYGKDLLGADYDPAEGFPLLAKLLDAADWLSIQVHPNNEQARQLEGQPRGKTEAWYIIEADDDAQLVIGVQPGTSREQMAEAITNNTLDQHLVYADVQAGDVLYIPAGTIHAIGPGILLYEIQQSSNTTYRLYDWGRMGLDGTPRELHIDKGVQVANVETLPSVVNRSGDHVTIVDGPYFATTLHLLNSPQQPQDFDTDTTAFHALTVIEGQATFTAGTHEVTAFTGQTVLVPASVGAYSVAGEGRVLRSWPRNGASA